MKSRLITACIAAVALSAPAVAFSADSGGMSKSPMSSAPKSEHGVVSDAAITTKIKAEFAKDRAVSMSTIHVDTDKGVVTLGGTAKSKAEADKAATIARNTSGVSSVRNDIKVQAN